jgi:hypothetical protein
MIRTALAGPKGERHGWQRIKAPGTFIFFVGSTGYVLIQITHQPTNVIQTHPVVSTNTVAALSMANAINGKDTGQK